MNRTVARTIALSLMESQFMNTNSKVRYLICQLNNHWKFDRDEDYGLNLTITPSQANYNQVMNYVILSTFDEIHSINTQWCEIACLTIDYGMVKPTQTNEKLKGVIKNQDPIPLHISITHNIVFIHEEPTSTHMHARAHTHTHK